MYPGYHDALRTLTKKYGTLLIIDETHTICCGPGGYTAAYGLKPDILTIGKPIGSGSSLDCDYEFIFRYSICCLRTFKGNLRCFG